MNKSKKYGWISVALLVLSVVFIVISLSTRTPADTESSAKKAERVLASRLDILQSFTDKALAADPAEWLDIGRLPSDMVIYRYVDERLQSWVNRFPISNDQLSSGMLFQSFLNPRSALRTPLGELKEDFSFSNIGSKWYLAKKVIQENVTLIVGLEIVNTLDTRSFSGINPRLRIPENHSIQELTNSGGSPVFVGGQPQFKILYNSLSSTPPVSMPYLWLALAFFLTAALFFLLAEPSAKNLIIELITVLAVLLAFYFSGAKVSVNSGLFSPLLYADGTVLYSLGALILLTLMLVMPIWSIFIARKDLRSFLDRYPLGVFRVLLLLAAAVALVAFSYVAIKSISLNSNINLELYKIKEITWVSVLVYLLLGVLFSCIPMIFTMLQPLTSRLFGFHQDSMSIPNRIGFALALAIYFVSLTACLGFKKEQSGMEVWANRLAVSRDIGLEMQLRLVEEKIADDPVIASLSVLPNAGAAIRNRIADNYLARVAQEYDLIVSVDGQMDLSLLSGGEYISPGSRFVFKEGSDALVVYIAVFTYYVKNYGPSHIMLQVERKGDWRFRGYASILGETAPGEVLIPPTYAYARYQSRSLLSFRGNFAYPVHMDDELADAVYSKEDTHMKSGGFTHFIYVVAEDESVIVSRRTIAALYYAVSGIFIGLITFLAQTILRPRRRKSVFEKKYFTTRLNAVIMASLILALVSMAALSVYFVYDRHEENRRTLMTEKINSIASSISTRIRGARTTDDLRSNEVLRLIEDVGNNTNSDITLYTPNGMVFMSTAPMVFERNMMDSRMDGEAYRNIMLLTSRYYIQKESVAQNKFYSMYAPLVGEDGNIIAIICAPYTDDTYDFETNVVNHGISILSIFIFLLLFAILMTRRVLDGMFLPLLQIGRKMEDANLDSLEYIQYDKEDEISSLVNAYNRMVTDLSESSRQLAEAERDKAWSGMARQVAHEIKNPLTPMKLQIQRIMRLKDRGDSAWKEKFDEVSKMLLDHINILTETANEFSTFAKLYTEEPTEINIGELVQEELAMFSGHEDITFDYMGLDDAVVMAPKPQLARVFVNLINNAVQALDEFDGGRVMVSLRHSVKDGYYDIVFEDNGPGVLPENTDKLFTPNFTTKTGGSGLGLAISRSILQKCGASISYSKSFALGGACFTILYPKNK